MRVAAASKRVASRAIANVLGKYPRRDQLKGARSKEAKQRRWAKLRARRSTTAASAAPPTISNKPTPPATTLYEAELREQLLRRKLDAAEARVKAERQRSRRDAKTALARGKQSQRRDGKAAARKRKASREKADRATANRAAQRFNSGKHPTGEPLHTGEHKRRRAITAAAAGYAHLASNRPAQ